MQTVSQTIVGNSMPLGVRRTIRFVFIVKFIVKSLETLPGCLIFRVGGTQNKINIIYIFSAIISPPELIQATL